MQLIDTHAHLYSKHFNKDRGEVLKDAQKANVNKIILPNIDIASIPYMMKMVESFSDICIPAIGLHPGSVNKDYQKDLEVVAQWLEKDVAFCAIGEIGMDLYWDKTFKTEQTNALLAQLEMAKKYDLPVIIHSRSAVKDILDVLKPYKDKINGVFHSYTGNREHAKQIIEMGFKIGVGGIVTFKNAGVAEVVRSLDLENLVLETDAPYLAPVPYRGKRNESAHLKYIVQKIAELFNCPFEKVAEVTTDNAKKVFKL